MNISVCIATYNGEKFIAEQLNSILCQLKYNDEIIIVDDCSLDNTVKVIMELNNPLIKIYINDKNYGHVYSFNRSIGLAKNKIILLSDQDDIWTKDRVEIMKSNLLSSKSYLLTANFKVMNTDGEIYEVVKGKICKTDSNRNLINILRIFCGNINYFGSLMIFTNSLKKIIFPIPSFVEAHDIWIALAANLLRKNQHINEIALIRRIHCNNVTNPNRNNFRKILTRFKFLVYIIVLTYRIFQHKLNKFNKNKISEGDF